MSSAASQKNAEIIRISKDLAHTPQCEEYERMISGMLYDPIFPKLWEARHRCRGAIQVYNAFDMKSLTYDKMSEIRLAQLREIVGRVGDGTFIEPPFFIDYGCNTIFGKDCFMNFNFTVLDTSLVIIGDRVSFGPNVHIYTAGHETSVLSRRKGVEFGHPVFIEDDCWIGGNVVILPGVRIGKGSTIAAASVVAKDVPPYSVAVGSPARVRKTIQSVEEEMADPANPYRDLVREE